MELRAFVAKIKALLHERPQSRLQKSEGARPDHCIGLMELFTRGLVFRKAKGLRVSQQNINLGKKQKQEKKYRYFHAIYYLIL